MGANLIPPFSLCAGERVTEWCEDIDNRINAAINHARHLGLVKGGDRIVVVTGSVGTSGSTNTIHIFTMEEEHSKLRVVGSSNEPEHQVESPWTALNTFAFTSGEESATNRAQQARRTFSSAHRYSVMLSRGNSVCGGVNDMRVPL